MMQKILLDLPSRIETERLLLRPYQPGDGEAYYELSQANKEHLTPFEAHNPILAIQTPDDAEKLVREFAVSWAARSIFFFGAWEESTDQLVAQIVLSPVDWELPEFALGYFVDVNHQGRGYVTEGAQAVIRFAFESLNAYRLSSGCNEVNTRSRRVLERCGFVQEGFRRQRRPHIKNEQGIASGDCLFGMLRSEFEER